MKRILFILFILSIAVSLMAQKTADSVEKKKILFVVTSHDKLGDTDEKTGFYLSEVTHPWKVLTDAGYEIDFISPSGGKAPVEALDLTDPVNKMFWDNELYVRKVENTLKPSQVNADDYQVIYYAGGHGAMWDFRDDIDLANLARKIYSSGGIIAAVCHGPAGLLNIKFDENTFLIDGKRISAFTNEEEKAVNKEKIVPFLLESTLIGRGAKFEKAGPWQPYVSVDSRIITGQNPQSATAVGEAILYELTK